MKPLVIYHANCYDGLLAAYAAWIVMQDTADYLPMSYDDIIDKSLVIGREVYFLDFSAKYEVLLALAALAEHITIIDHHKTAQADLSKPLPGNISLIFDMEKAGCVLTAEDFLGHVPWFFDFIGDRDIWKFQYPDTKNFCAGFTAKFPLHDTTFEDLRDALASVSHEHMSMYELARKDDICATGETLIDYRQTLMEGWMAHVEISQLSLENFNGPIGVLTGIPKEFVSEMGHLVMKEKPGLQAVAMLNIIHDGRNKPMVACSWRSVDERADVSEIAKAFGGGGHRNAAGCSMTLELAMVNGMI